jgi:hypothetical protein
MRTSDMANVVAKARPVHEVGTAQRTDQWREPLYGAPISSGVETSEEVIVWCADNRFDLIITPCK